MELGAQRVEAHVGEAGPLAPAAGGSAPVRDTNSSALSLRWRGWCWNLQAALGQGLDRVHSKTARPLLLAADVGQLDHHAGRDGCGQMRGMSRSLGTGSPRGARQAGWATAACLTDRSPLTPGVRFST